MLVWHLQEFPTGPTGTSGEKKEFKPWSPFPSLSGSGAVVLRQGGDLAQVETFYSPQKGPGNCTRPLPSASKAENWPCELFLAARPLRQLLAVTVGGALRLCRCLMTHAGALRNLVVTAVFRAASHADVPGWSPVHATWEPPPGGISLGA